MSRVSENSSAASIKYSIGKAKKKLEDLQLKGASLRGINKPSDNPIANVEALALSSVSEDNKQFLKNASFASLNLSIAERSLEQLTDILVKAKEIAIAQASDLYNPEVRKSVANEVAQLRQQALAVANKRIGQKHIFSGYKTLTPPFDDKGKYFGDTGKITLEVSKDFFVPINLHGREIFFGEQDNILENLPNPLDTVREDENPELKKAEPVKKPDQGNSRDLASEEVSSDGYVYRNNLFAHLDSLVSALENDDSELIQSILESFDEDIDRLIAKRTKIGSIVNSIENAKSSIQAENIDNAERRSELTDADVTDLFSDIVKQQAVLETTYKSTEGMISKNLMDFLR